MGFMKSYKYLDNLCRDMNGIGITGYIKDMEQEPKGEFYAAGWKKDYLQLKHYRHIRNQIAHENYANEDDLCSAEDTAWLDGFYQRIMEQTDPLALCYKETRFRTGTESSKKKDSFTVQYDLPDPEWHQSTNRPNGYGMFLLIVIVFVMLIFLVFRQL